MCNRSKCHFIQVDFYSFSPFSLFLFCSSEHQAEIFNYTPDMIQSCLGCSNVIRLRVKRFTLLYWKNVNNRGLFEALCSKFLILDMIHLFPLNLLLSLSPLNSIKDKLVYQRLELEHVSVFTKEEVDVRKFSLR